jgi:hypothetical protein
MSRAMTHCMAIVKNRAINVLCLCSSIVCNRKQKGRSKAKEHEKMKRKEYLKNEENKGQPNPLTCESHIFIYWTLKLNPKPLCLHTHSLYLTKFFNSNVKKDQIQGFILLQFSL